MIIFRTILIITLLFSGIYIPATAQSSGEILDTRISEAISGKFNLGILLARIAYHYQVPIGLEYAASLDEKEEIEPNISPAIHGKTLRDLLNAIVQADQRYEWREEWGVIQVFPEVRQDGILDVVVAQFQTHSTSSQTLKQLITNDSNVSKKMGEMKIHLVDIVSFPGGLAPVSEIFSIDTKNVTVRQILNEIAKTSYNHYWEVSRIGKDNDLLIINF